MNLPQLIESISQTADYFQREAIRQVNSHLTLRNWVIGFYLFEYEQKGQDRAQYGERLYKTIVDKTMDLLLTKYLKSYIRYEGWNRVEELPIPETALREAVLNAIAHKDYSGNTPIQIRVYPNKIVIWNQGQLPENWTVAQLVQAHPSVPYNPAIANVLFRAGLIEAWGSGILRMISDCQKENTPPPIFKYDFSGFIIEFDAKQEVVAEKSSEKSSEKILLQYVFVVKKRSYTLKRIKFVLC